MRLLFIVSVLLIFPLAQIAIDIYLPSLPNMGLYFFTTNQELQLSLTVYIFALGISQLLYGPFSDKYGRKFVLLFGMFISLIGTFCCLYSHSINELLISRVIQGIGMGSCFVVGSAILGDTFEGKRLAQMVTASTTIYALSPLLIPVLGGYLEYLAGWKLNFIFILLFTLLLVIMIVLFIPETNKNKDCTINLKKSFTVYKQMLITPKFIGYILCSISGYGINIAFNVLGPYLLQKTYNLSIIESGYVLLLVGLSYCIGTVLNQKLLMWFSVNKSLFIGILLMLFFSCFMVFLSFLNVTSFIVVIALICSTIVSTGFIFSNCFTKSLESFPESLGTASALFGSGGLIGVAFISWIVSFIQRYDIYSIGVVFLLVSIFGLLIYLFLLKGNH